VDIEPLAEFLDMDAKNIVNKLAGSSKNRSEILNFLDS
jgi:hypothetical protein